MEFLNGTQEWSFGLESVTRIYIQKVLSSKWVKYPFHTDVLVIYFLFVLFSAKIIYAVAPDFNKYNRKTRKVIEIKKKKIWFDFKHLALRS